MDGKELEKYIKDLAKSTDSIMIPILIECNYGRAIVFEVGENLNLSFLSGDIIAFWADGENTCLDNLENIKIINKNLFKL